MVDRQLGLVTVTFPTDVTDAAAASKEIVDSVEKLVNGKFRVENVKWKGERATELLTCGVAKDIINISFKEDVFLGYIKS